MATIVTIDFKNVAKIRQHPSGKTIHSGDKPIRPIDENGLLLTEKQIRARARRRDKRSRGVRPTMSDLEFERLYKPVEEWDIDELARGRPRDKDGGFKGPKPKWLTRELHERAMDLFKEALKTDLALMGVDALKIQKWVMDNDERDDRGKPLVPATAKLQASHFVLEHIIGKPKQHTEVDVSVKLQSILSDVMVNAVTQVDPDTGDSYGAIEGGYTMAHFPGETLAIGSGGDDIVDAEVVDDGQ